ncbi:GNAT family N-acetyltransferase [Candidatus Gottesmanbacteria bacterium]|nr:GNAT family N-acetyltransferase [Candidatus Gottesmanbacteria bacterium]
MAGKQNLQSISIRPYIPKDYPSIRRILEEGGLYYDEMDNENRLKEKVTRDPQSILVAIEASRIIGTVSIMEDGRMAFIFRLGVQMEQKGSGVGTRLLQEAETILHERGYNEVHILVDENNPELQKYYEQRGYERGHMYCWMSKEF